MKNGVAIELDKDPNYFWIPVKNDDHPESELTVSLNDEEKLRLA